MAMGLGVFMGCYSGVFCFDFFFFTILRRYLGMVTVIPYAVSILGFTFICFMSLRIVFHFSFFFVT